MFNVLKSSFGKFESILLTNDSTGETAEIINGYGAILNKLEFMPTNKLVNIIDGYQNDLELKSNGLKAYKSSILFPFPNRIRNGLYSHLGKMYQFPLNDGDGRTNALHGFLADKPFEVRNLVENNSEASVELVHEYDGKNGAFPFPFQIKVIYTLSDAGLEIKSKIKNTGTITAPLGFGWHCYFQTGSKLDLLKLKFPKHQIFEVNESLIPTGKMMEGFNFLVPEEMENIFLDTGYKLEELGNAIFEIIDEQQNFKINIDIISGENKFNFAQIYTPDSRKSIAIEPQSCAADVFNNKIGLILAQPDQEFEFTYAISTSKLD